MTAGFLLDTNVLSELNRATPDPSLIARLTEHENELATASVVWHELVFGASRLPPSRQRSRLEHFLVEVVAATVAVLPYDAVAADWHGRERARLMRSGRTPSFVDGQIAAVAAVNGLVLVTYNVRHFEGFDGVRVEQWHGRGS